MKVEVRGRKLRVSEAMRAYAERRLWFALGRFQLELGALRVRLEDVNGPRGGVDKRCTVEITGPRLGTVHVEALDADMYAAIDQAAQAASRVVKGTLSRLRATKVAPSKSMAAAAG